MDIRKLDLNLLVLLDALMSESSVTRAAQRVHLSQPAMSAALNRLREIFDDPLLVRVAGGMEPTRKAREVIVPVREALTTIQRAVTPTVAYDPRFAERTFAVAASEYASFVIMPDLAQELERLAPRINLAIVRLNLADPLEPLRSGAVDAVIAAYAGEGSYIHRSVLFTERYVCIAKKHHPRIFGHLTLRQFIQCSHVVIRQQTGGVAGIVDALFHKLGKPRKNPISLPDLLALPHIITQTEHIATVAERVATSLIKQFPLQLLPHPVRKDQFPVSQFWHERMHSDPIHCWLRELIQEVCRGLDSPMRRNSELSAPQLHAPPNRNRKRRVQGER